MKKHLKPCLIFIVALATTITACRLDVNDNNTIPFTHYKILDFTENGLAVEGSGKCIFQRSNANTFTTFRIDSLKFDRVSVFSANALFGLTVTPKNDSLFRGVWYCPSVDTTTIESHLGQMPLIISTFYNPTTMANEHHLFWNNEYGLFAVYDKKSQDLIIFERGPEDFKRQLVNYLKKRR